MRPIDRCAQYINIYGNLPEWTPHLHQVVQEAKRYNHNNKDRCAVTDDNKRAQHTQDLRQGLPQRLRQVIVHHRHVAGETVDDAAWRSCVEEAHWCTHDVGQHGGMEGARSSYHACSGDDGVREYHDGWKEKCNDDDVAWW